MLFVEELVCVPNFIYYVILLFMIEMSLLIKEVVS